ncbi:MAG: DUF1269 domain-containing protein [Candidatus Sedimenticola sp. 6PFRAG7]
MQRLFILLPDTETCSQVVVELQGLGVAKRQLHVIASLSKTVDNLPVANVLQKTELIHGVIKGLVIGGIAGLSGGLLLLNYPPAGLTVENAVIPVAAAGGALMGAVVSALISSREHNRRLDPYQLSIEQGKLLLLADVPRCDTDKIRNLVCRGRPGVQVDQAV